MTYTVKRVIQVGTESEYIFDFVGFPLAQFTSGTRSGGSSKDLPVGGVEHACFITSGFQAGWRGVYRTARCYHQGSHWLPG